MSIELILMSFKNLKAPYSIHSKNYYFHLKVGNKEKISFYDFTRPTCTYYELETMYIILFKSLYVIDRIFGSSGL